ncbi:MAG: hypothetical protein AAEJ04_11500 [Planctomycetota bacterium]|jgi:hypothetical protein
MTKRSKTRRVHPNRGPSLLAINLEGNSIPGWGPFVYKVAIILTLIILSIGIISTMIIVLSSTPNFMTTIVALGGLAAQILAGICGLALLKLLLEYLSRSVRIEQKMNEQVVESS